MLRASVKTNDVLIICGTSSMFYVCAFNVLDTEHKWTKCKQLNIKIRIINKDFKRFCN